MNSCVLETWRRFIFALKPDQILMNNLQQNRQMHPFQMSLQVIIKTKTCTSCSASTKNGPFTWTRRRWKDKTESHAPWWVMQQVLFTLDTKRMRESLKSCVESSTQTGNWFDWEMGLRQKVTSRNHTGCEHSDHKTHKFIISWRKNPHMHIIQRKAWEKTE